VNITAEDTGMKVVTEVGTGMKDMGTEVGKGMEDMGMEVGTDMKDMGTEDMVDTVDTMVDTTKDTTAADIIITDHHSHEIPLIPVRNSRFIFPIVANYDFNRLSRLYSAQFHRNVIPNATISDIQNYANAH
jgi:hypothetical protein